MLNQETASLEGTLTDRPTPADIAAIAAPILAARCTYDAKSDIAWAVSEAYLLWQEARRFCEAQKEP